LGVSERGSEERCKKADKENFTLLLTSGGGMRGAQ